MQLHSPALDGNPLVVQKRKFALWPLRLAVFNRGWRLTDEKAWLCWVSVHTDWRGKTWYRRIVQDER